MAQVWVVTIVEMAKRVGHARLTHITHNFGKGGLIFSTRKKISTNIIHLTWLAGWSRTGQVWPVSHYFFLFSHNTEYLGLFWPMYTYLSPQRIDYTLSKKKKSIMSDLWVLVYVSVSVKEWEIVSPNPFSHLPMLFISSQFFSPLNGGSPKPNPHFHLCFTNLTLTKRDLDKRKVTSMSRELPSSDLRSNLCYFKLLG